MKKRKPPILLGAFCFILVGGAIAVNASNFSAPADGEQAEQKLDPEAAKKKEEFLKKQAETVKKRKEQFESADPELGIMTNIKPKTALNKEEPKVLRPRGVKVKKPEAAVEGQWYSKESGMNSKSGN